MWKRSANSASRSTFAARSNTNVRRLRWQPWHLPGPRAGDTAPRHGSRAPRIQPWSANCPTSSRTLKKSARCRSSVERNPRLIGQPTRNRLNRHLAPETWTKPAIPRSAVRALRHRMTGIRVCIRPVDETRQAVAAKRRRDVADLCPKPVQSKQGQRKPDVLRECRDQKGRTLPFELQRNAYAGQRRKRRIGIEYAEIRRDGSLCDDGKGLPRTDQGREARKTAARAGDAIGSPRALQRFASSHVIERVRIGKRERQRVEVRGIQPRIANPDERFAANDVFVRRVFRQRDHGKVQRMHLQLFEQSRGRGANDLHQRMRVLA
ncbi:hypothetical protein BG61_31380 [Caballeronia glathei]|uniref:Uncharacterized protein n=1 Tax=Caballeronia glathei TaxID=60547 RepID=A0A069PFX3_9BURK|nr:hypothetical protein BG61_31380 [Caballeronia glathei]